MCGIFGLAARTATLPRADCERWLSRLFLLSETRGRESSGVTVIGPDSIRFLKSALRAKDLLTAPAYQELLDESFAGWSSLPVQAVFGHSRLVTNGGQNIHANNQPVPAGRMVGVHNGIIVNDASLWAAHPEVERTAEVDTEVLMRLVDQGVAEGLDWPDAFRRAASQVEGTFSVAMASAAHDALLLATNNGSLYHVRSAAPEAFVFASEYAILADFARQSGIGKDAIQRLEPGQALLVSLTDMTQSGFSLDALEAPTPVVAARVRTLEDATPAALRHSAVSSMPAYSAERLSQFEIDPAPIRALRRCTRCILPETVPFILFDAKGVCNFCNGHQPKQYKGEAALRDAAQQLMARRESRGALADCLFTFSGGRDSSWGLHYAVKVLGLKPVTYTYDWGLITDLARRNQARMCGALGVEHILVSADIAAKRDNVRRNVSAWLRRPALGMIPLFMAGDKHYFYFANKVAGQMGLDSILLASNPLEKTHFKAGFCGVEPTEGHRPGRLRQARMVGYYAGHFLSNPAYLNRSLFDTFGAFASYYMIGHDHLRLFDYIPWIEKEVEGTLLGEYDWETAPDTRSTWRIGDGTAAFYNYIYYQVAGFTENDTFRSNQIREGMMSRERALALIETENAARFESLAWYCSVIGLDLHAVLARIRQMPTLYPRG